SSFAVWLLPTLSKNSGYVKEILSLAEAGGGSVVVRVHWGPDAKGAGETLNVPCAANNPVLGVHAVLRYTGVSKEKMSGRRGGRGIFSYL
ncbi:MAG: hypothetical protein WCD46_01180, partial [Desulfobacterales bacterium]